MFKGIKKKLTSNRSNGRNRRLGGRDLGDSPPREPPDRGGTKPISPRQIHPSDQVAPLPYSRRSAERSRTAPMKSYPENIVSRVDSHSFYGAQRHTLQGPAYPTSPNICVTGGKIEFVTSTGSPISSEAPVNSSTKAASPLKDYSTSKHQSYYSSPRNYRKKEGNNYMTSPKFSNHSDNVNSRTPFSIYSSSEFKSSSPTSSTTSRSSRRKSRLERKRNTYDTKSNSLMQHSLPPRSPDTTKQRSATMPVREDINELEVLKQENSQYKNKLVLMQRELSQVEEKVVSLQREKHERIRVEDETCKEKLSQYQVAINLLEKLLKEGEIRKRKISFNNKSCCNENIMERCSALEHANEQLQQEAQSQRQEYEKCLDNVALQVVQAIIVQKKQQEECERLSKKVQVLQKQNNNLSSLLANKSKSMSPTYAQDAKCYELLNQCSQSLPNTLHKQEKKRTSKNSGSNESELSRSTDENSQSKSELTDPVDKCDTACWYDVIKAIKNGDNRKEGCHPVPTNSPPDQNGELAPSNHVQTDCHSSSLTAVITSRPNSAYTQSSNHQQLIVNSLTSCIPSYLPPATPATTVSTIILNKTLNKVPFINQSEKIVTEGIIKDEGYSTMSSDVQTEPKVSVSTIATVEEEKIKANESDGETEKTESPTKTHPEYMDGLRIVYDDEDASSDVFLIAIQDGKDRSLVKPKAADVCRSLSESDLSDRSVLSKSLLRKAKDFNDGGMPYFSINKKNLINLQLKSLINRGISKRARNSRKQDGNAFSLDRNVNRDKFNSLDDDNSNSPSTYSHAEMEDWSLELSAEDLSTATDSIVSVSNFPHGEQSLRESSNFGMEDQPELSWTGGNFAERTLDWQYEKSMHQPWLNNNSRSMTSPKSGCSDQPAIWSSVEHLSSCSDVASKCSTDIENFCDQLCKLPELKRLSLSSMENTPDCISNLINCSEAVSLEDNRDLNENAGLDNVFTRDFYRLIKFESTKSLAESSRSLALSETSQTLDRLKSKDSSINKTFTSVLGFIVEQQKYCKQRELLDERSKFDIGMTPDSSSNNNKNLTNQTFILDNANISTCNTTPAKPKRSTSLNLSNGYVRSKGTLPSVPSVPSPPSRSSSRATLPRHSIHSQHSSTVDSFVSPPKTSQEIVPKVQPPVPPHRFLLQSPLLPERSSSKHRDSPPVPKRITSRALPTPPARPPAALSFRPTASTLRPTVPPPAVPKQCPVPARSSSLVPDRFKRSNSLQAPAHSKAKSRNSCGDLAPNCKTSQNLLIHLKKMVQDEDESNNERSSPDPSPDDVGLGTGWVRVAPFSDFTDTKNRANILDSMMPSSEAGSSETDDSSRTRPQEHLLKTAQRNRRRKKVLRHKEDCSISRTSHDRVDYDERSSLNTFQFLDSLSSSSEDHVGPQCLPISKFNENLDSLRSSEMCNSSLDFCCQGGESLCDTDMFDQFVSHSPHNLASTKVHSVPIQRNNQKAPQMPSSVRQSNIRPCNAILRQSNSKNSRNTSRPASLTLSSCSTKNSVGSPRLSNLAVRPHTGNPGGTPKTAKMSLKLMKSESFKGISDPLNIAYQYTPPLNKNSRTNPLPSNVDTKLSCPLKTRDTKTVTPSQEADDFSNTQVMERKNSLVFRIKEAFERSNWQQKSLPKNGFEKERLKSPNFKAVIEKFSQPTSERLPISIFSNKNERNVYHNKDAVMDARYVLNKNNKSKSHKEKNLPPKSSPPKSKNNPQSKSNCGKTAKIPILSNKISKKAALSCDKGRLSISDSCAEAFSPLSSEDEEVFRKAYYH